MGDIGDVYNRVGDGGGGLYGRKVMWESSKLCGYRR
jgi:hypothetical protein